MRGKDDSPLNAFIGYITYEIRTSFVIRNTLALDFSLGSFLVEYKRHGILSSLRIVIESLQGGAYCTTFKQLEFTLLIDFQRTVEVKFDFASTVVRSCTNTEISTTIFDEGTNTFVAPIAEC